MISARNLTVSYGQGQAALVSLDFCVAAGDLAVLTGANGSGKSTLLALLAGLLGLESGTLEAAGLCLPGQERELRQAARLVVQDADMQILGASVAEDMLLGRRPVDLDAARAMAARFGLLESWDSPVQSLSWGMRRKLCLATALLDAPRLLLLDEPFAGLDYSGTLEMRRILRANQAAGLTQVLATHDLDPVADLAQSVLVLERGRLVLGGRPEAVMAGLRDHGVRPPCSWLARGALCAWEEGDGR